MSEQDADNFPFCISVCSRHGRFLGLICLKCRTITNAIVVERWPTLNPKIRGNAFGRSRRTLP